MDNSEAHMVGRMKNMGESSSARRNHYAASLNASDYERERPFKKARYVWQLKGKYHLKANCASFRNRHCHRNSKSRQSRHSSNSSDTDSETESKSDKKMYDSNIINTLLIRSNALLDDDELFEDEHVTNIDKAISDDIPITLVKPNHRTHEEFLEKWHRRQVAKSYVDNTINSLMELWKIAPFDATDLVESCENDEQVEDEGILMAIQSHGLQTSLPNHIQHRNFECEPSTASTSHSLIQMPLRTFDDPSNSDDSDDHFLTAAVSAAIQKKGLSSYNYG